MTEGIFAALISLIGSLAGAVIGGLAQRGSTPLKPKWGIFGGAIIGLLAGIFAGISIAGALIQPSPSPTTPSPSPSATFTPESDKTLTPMTTNFYRVSISRISEFTEPATMTLGLLEPGIHDLLDIPFEIGWQATTQCEYLPKRPTQMSLDTFVPKPINVYIILNGTGMNQKDGGQVGIIKLVFSDGWSSDTPVRFGVNIRNWALDRDPYAIVTTTSPSVREALRGFVYLPPPENKTVTGVMDVLTIPIATERQQAELTRIEIVDTTFEETGLVDPCMHVSSITVEYRR